MNPTTATAADRALELLADPPADPDVSRGYLDLLGEAGPEYTGLATRLMNTGILPVVYERWWRPAWGLLLTGRTRGQEHALARELLQLRDGVVVLDVACGPGNFTRDFARAVAPGGLAVGIDASPTMLARAMEDTPEGDAAYVRGDAVELPFRDESFDAVCCFAALHMFPDPQRALEQMARVLRPAGRVALLTSRRRHREPLRSVDAVTGHLSGLRMFGTREIASMLERAGFADVVQHPAGATQIVAARAS